jgi:hypothetical protein
VGDKDATAPDQLGRVVALYAQDDVAPGSLFRARLKGASVQSLSWSSFFLWLLGRSNGCLRIGQARGDFKPVVVDVVGDSTSQDPKQAPNQ